MSRTERGFDVFSKDYFLPYILKPQLHNLPPFTQPPRRRPLFLGQTISSLEHDIVHGIDGIPQEPRDRRQQALWSRSGFRLGQRTGRRAAGVAFGVGAVVEENYVREVLEHHDAWAIGRYRSREHIEELRVEGRNEW